MVRDVHRVSRHIPFNPGLPQPVLHKDELAQGGVFHLHAGPVTVRDMPYLAVSSIAISCPVSVTVCFDYGPAKGIIAVILLIPKGIPYAFHLSKGIPLIKGLPVFLPYLSFLADVDQPVFTVIGILRPVPQGIRYRFQLSAQGIFIVSGITIGVSHGNDIPQHVVGITLLLSFAAGDGSHPSHAVISVIQAVSLSVRLTCDPAQLIIGIVHLLPIRIDGPFKPSSRQIEVSCPPANGIRDRRQLSKGIVFIPGGVSTYVRFLRQFPCIIVCKGAQVPCRVRDAADMPCPVVCIDGLPPCRIGNL